MNITDLHGMRDDVPLAVRGAGLEENGELKNFYGQNLARIFRENGGQDPIASEIKLGLKGFKPGVLFPLFWIDARTYDWRLKRRMKKMGADFAYIQFGALYDCYDFYRLSAP